jgi:hypothetical protein
MPSRHVTLPVPAAHPAPANGNGSVSGQITSGTETPESAAREIIAAAAAWHAECCSYEALLHKPIAQLTPADIARLPALQAAIARGEVAWFQRRGERRV